MNVQKSSIYVNGVPARILQQICLSAGMKLELLPFSYLGIPIAARKFSVIECFVLVEKVVARIRALGSRHLSYGGRLALLHSYWARIFILSKSIIKRIEDTCRNFLWRGSHIYISAPSIAWDQICKDPEMGVLGIRKAYEWNIASVGKYIWWIASKKDHLWVKWVNGIYLRGTDWRDMKCTVNSTWSWRRICHVKEAVIDGYMGEWWISAGNEYSVQKVYQWLTRGDTVVPWWQFVWNRFRLPRQRFISWMAMHQRLYTNTRLARFGVVSDGLCCLCADEAETQAHLFFECVFSRKCLQILSSKLGMYIPCTDTWQWWDNNRFQNMFVKKLVRDCIIATLYSIWHCRNLSLFYGVILLPSVVMDKLCRDIQCRCRSVVSGHILVKFDDWIVRLGY
ncbi:hypothetical protein RND81_11G079000 [Saponaria officinalis]|uniref:Reverse transcriptase zinc-binding domain-containing protein n=1 Tax=Saponaria officinalis TaxID=3572 RepID=A0AAW1HJC2_SAPOF